jgi:DNA-binding HxlR family transcriptional regulator
MKRQDVKSRCPINFGTEVFGDSWSLLILREMAASGRKTFNEFLRIEERIGSSVLADRLAHLEKNGIILKQRDPDDKRKTSYALTPQGIDALPILYEVAAWGSRTSPNPQATEAWFKALTLDRYSVLTAWRSALETGSSFFAGDNSVVKQLDL